jgi:hypothetical protein
MAQIISSLELCSVVKGGSTIVFGTCIDGIAWSNVLTDFICEKIENNQKYSFTIYNTVII